MKKRKALDRAIVDDPANADCSAPARISGASARDDQGPPDHLQLSY